MVIHERLREERARLGLHQKDVASLVGMTPRAQLMYEAGDRHPDSKYLAALAASGFDIGYILTGQRTSADFTATEIDLVHAYRNATPAGRLAVMTVLNATTPGQPPAPRQVFNAPVGQVIENNKGSARTRLEKNERTKTHTDPNPNTP